MNSRSFLFSLAVLAILFAFNTPFVCHGGGVPGQVNTGVSSDLLNPAINDNVQNLPLLTSVTIPFTDHFSFHTDSLGRVNYQWYTDNHYIYLLEKPHDDVGNPVAGVIFKAERDGAPNPPVAVSLRLVLASPVPADAVPSLRFYPVLPLHNWSSLSFQGQGCSDSSGNCYSSPVDIIDREKGVEITGEIRQESELGGRSVLYADITSCFTQYGFSYEDGIFMELQNDIEGNGLFGAVTFFGKDAPWPVLSASLIFTFDARGVEQATLDELGISECGDGICDPNETCESECVAGSDIDPPGIQFTITPFDERMDENITLNLHVVMTGEEDSSSSSQNSPAASAPTLNQTTTTVQAPDTGMPTTPINPDILDMGRFVPLAIWAAGMSTTPWNRGLCGSDEGECSVEITPEPGSYMICARAADNAGNVSPVSCRQFRIGTATPPQISVNISPQGVYLGENLHVHVSAFENNEGLRSVNVNLPGTDLAETVAGTTWSNDFELPLCDWQAAEPGKLDPINISVTATDGEGMSALYTDTIEPRFPLQASYGLGVENFGSDLCWNQYEATFGNDIYASVSLCAFPPFVFPGACWDNLVCKCYSGTPGSTTQEIIDRLGGWIVDAIIEAIDTNGRLNDYFCVNDLSELGVPDLFALLYFPVYHVAGRQGQCTGFTAASALLSNHKAAPDEICPGCGSRIASWSKEDISFYVGHQQGTVCSAEFIHQFLAGFTDSTQEAIDKLNTALSRGEHPGISIIGFPDETRECSAAGHTMLVDRVRNMGNGIYRIYVYDSNRPDTSGIAETDQWHTSYNGYCDMDHSPYIEVNTATNNFSFLLGHDPRGIDAYWTRGTGKCTIHVETRIGEGDVDLPMISTALLYLPLSLFEHDTFTLPLSVEGFITLVAGNADVSVEDSAGNVMGTAGVQTGSIPGAFIIPAPADDGSGEGVTVILIPEDTIFTVHAYGKNDTGHALAILSPRGASAFLLAGPASRETFTISPQADGLKVGTGQDAFQGALHLLARQQVKAGDIAPEADESVKDEELFYTRVYSFKGSFGTVAQAFLIENDGTLTAISQGRNSFRAYAISNSEAGNVDRNKPLATLFSTAAATLELPAGVTQISLSAPNGAAASIIKTAVPEHNAAPATAMSPHTLDHPAASPAETVVLRGSGKTLVGLAPTLHLPDQMNGRTGRLYAVLHWLDTDQWFLFTPSGLQPLGDNLIPFATATLGIEARFNLLSGGYDLSDLKGTFDIFTGVAASEDLSDLVYNYYRVEFR